MSNITERFAKLDPQIVQRITLFKDGPYSLYMTNSALGMSNEIFIKPVPNIEHKIPSKEGNWYLYELLGRQILSVEETEKYAYVKADNGYEIDVNTYFDPDDFTCSIHSTPNSDDYRKEDVYEKSDHYKIEELFQNFSTTDADRISFTDDSVEITFYTTDIKILSKMSIETPQGSFDIPSKEGNWALYELFKAKLIGIQELESFYVLDFDNGSKIKTQKFANDNPPAFTLKLWYDSENDWNRREFLF